MRLNRQYVSFLPRSARRLHEVFYVPVIPRIFVKENYRGIQNIDLTTNEHE